MANKSQIHTAIREAAFAVEAWQAVVDLIAEMLPGTQVSLWSGRRVNGPRRVVFKSGLRGLASQSAPSGEAAGADCGVVDRLTLFQDGDRYASLEIRSEGRPASCRRGSADLLLGELAPSLREAIQINRRHAHKPNSAIRAVADVSAKPMFILNLDGGIWLTNASGKELLDKGGAASLDAQGRLVPNDPAARDNLNRVRRQWSEGKTKEAFLDRLGGEPRSSWSFVPYCDARYAACSWLDRSAPLMIASFNDRNTNSRYDLGAFSSEYGLTPAEIRLTSVIASGGAVQDASAQFGIAVGTARNQLKSVFNKTGVRRQNELVALLAMKYAS